MDIEYRLQHLLNKYGLDKNHPDQFVSLKIVYYINELFEGLAKAKKKIYICCGGNHTRKLYKVLSDENKDRVCAVIDDNCIDNSGFSNWKVIRKSEAMYSDDNIFVLSSYRYELELKIELINVKHVVSIYDYLKSKGIYINYNFYDFRVSNINYRNVFLLRRKMEIAEKDGNDIDFLLEELIYCCCIIKDFISVFSYVKKYILCSCRNEQMMQMFSTELKLLLNSIKEKIYARKQKDIIINWIDALRFEDGVRLDVIKNNKGILFNNAYTVIPYTRSVLNSIFSGKLEVKDFNGKISEPFSEENSPFIKTLNQSGYKFRYLSYQNLYDEMLKDEYRNDYFFENKIEILDKVGDGCSTKLQWNLLDIIINSSQKCCVIVHNLVESHIPFYNSDMQYYINGDFWSSEKWDYEYNDRYKCGVEFIDRQLCWYQDYYPVCATKIYMSDHGPTCDCKNYSEERSHVIIKVCDKTAEDRKENRLFSYKDYWKLIRYCTSTNKDNYDDIFSEYVFHEAMDFYNEYCINIMKRWIVEKNKLVSHIRRYCQYRGVRTYNEVYVKYAFGKEGYYRDKDYCNNLINDERYSSRIDELRKILGEGFIDISSNTKFRHMRELYDYIDINDVNIEW